MAEIRTVGVVGLGTMGAGIAQVCAQADVETIGVEVTDELGERARERIGHYLGRGVEKGRLTAEERDAALARFRTTTDRADLAGCDLVIEAIVEDLDAKRELFAELDGIVAPDAVLATNTSALSVTEIARATAHPERVVGMHFFNPAPVLPLVEIVRTELAADEPYERAYAFAERAREAAGPLQRHAGLHRQPDPHPPPERLRAGARRGRRDAGRPRPRDALRRGLADRAVRARRPDRVDIHVHASEALHAALGEERMAPPERLVQMAEAGDLGRKTGRGFFEYGSV